MGAWMPMALECNVFCTILLLMPALMHINIAQEVLFEAPPNANCACLGDVLVYQCRVVGPGSTKWNGTAFSCNDNEIILRHSVYGGPGGASGECNSGAIIGRSVEVAGNRYTSQLSVSASDKVSSNTTVRCVYNGNTAEVIGTSTLMIVSAAYQQPSDIRLVNPRPESITFNWSSVSEAGDCSSLRYIITSDGCGDCPSAANSTEATCSTSNLTLPSLCTLRVQSTVCGFQSTSGTVEVALELPEATRVLDVIPHYRNSTGDVVKLTIIINQTMMDFSDNNVLKVTGYNISYIDSTSGSIFNSSSIPIPCATTIVDNLVQCVVDLPATTLCPALISSNTTINVSISAVNGLGQGPNSEHNAVGCRYNRDFVKVQYIRENNIISCTFQNRPDTTGSSCSLIYGPCDGSLSYSIPESGPIGLSGTILLKLDSKFANQMFCYAITATSATESIIVEGQVNKSSSNGSNTFGQRTVIIIAAVVPILVLLCLLVLVVMAFCLLRRSVTHEDAVGNEGSSDANSYKIERTKMLIIIMIAQLHIK